MTGLSKALGIVAILSRADRRYGPCWHGDIAAALRVVDGDTVNVLDLEASTSEAFRWLDIAAAFGRSMCATRHVCADRTI
ncbi:hypothetical protein [Mycobacteroides abscessus]|uniref:hypothetical protein n=1 Tax=Mycobacteroides abscessus TaxID=36809 RepID=UPI00092ABA5F|nr:hypothetical protein [Mycobacteroides abscessus]SHW90932.1 Uncharacterised protein [Mycobacteroides abscessus subsp. abscessus]SII12442.1 Uncharacterised protein [Mycobacteroides abscessus subsp. abscessus]